MINKDSDIEIIISKYLSKEAIPEEIKVLDDWISAAPENKQVHDKLPPLRLPPAPHTERFRLLLRSRVSYPT